MKKLLFLGLLLVGLFMVVSCAPTDDGLTPEERELFGEDESALAGEAISLGCGSPAVVTSCSSSGSSSLLVNIGTRTVTVADRCSGGMAIDFSCVTPTSFQFCRSRCESTEDCVGGRCILRCGNGVINTGETCSSCAADVVCAAGQVCTAGVCTLLLETICDGIDNNANGVIDEGCDDDNDDYCQSGMTISGPPYPTTCSNGGGDCADSNTTINPGATELCFNLADDNCVDGIDEGCSPYTCTDSDPNNDIAIGGTITITAANGEVYSSYSSRYSDSCKNASFLNQSGCINASSSTYYSLTAPAVDMACPSCTICTDSDGSGGTPAVCS